MEFNLMESSDIMSFINTTKVDGKVIVYKELVIEAIEELQLRSSLIAQPYFTLYKTLILSSEKEV